MLRGEGKMPDAAPKTKSRCISVPASFAFQTSGRTYSHRRDVSLVNEGMPVFRQLVDMPRPGRRLLPQTENRISYIRTLCKKNGIILCAFPAPRARACVDRQPSGCSECRRALTSGPGSPILQAKASAGPLRERFPAAAVLPARRQTWEREMFWSSEIPASGNRP